MNHFDWSSTRAPFEHFTALEEAGVIRRKFGAKRYGLVVKHPAVAAMLKERP